MPAIIVACRSSILLMVKLKLLLCCLQEQRCHLISSGDVTLECDEKCKEMYAKYNGEHHQFERIAVYVREKCMVLDRSLKNTKQQDLKVDGQADESVKKIVPYYRGVSRYHLGLLSAMADQHPEATAHFEQAIDFFDESLDVNYELKSVEGYLPSVQKTMLRMNSDERLEKLKRLFQNLH